jgi:hypothetical protein
MAAPVYQSYSEVIGSGTTATPSEPSGTSSGDILVGLIVAANTATVGLPSGWTSISSGTAGTSFKWALGWIARTGSAPSYAFTCTPSAFRQVIVARISGADTTAPIDAAPSPASGTSATGDSPSATATTSEGLALAWLAHWSGSNPFVAPTGYTLRGNTGNSDIGLASKTLSVSGAEDPAAWGAASGGSGEWRAFTLILAPVAAGSVDKSGSDSATLSETSEVAISTTTAEGTLSESSALEQQYTATDSFALTESSSVSDDTSKAGTDTAAFSESSSVDKSEAVVSTDSFAFTEIVEPIAQAVTDSWSMAESASVDTGAPPPSGDGYHTQLPTLTTPFVEYSSQVSGTVRVTACIGDTRITESTGTLRVAAATGTTRTSEVTYSIVTTEASGTLRTTTVEATV